MMKRRDFLRHAGLGLAGLAARPYVHGRWFQGRASRETDIVIFGGGAGGLCAGIQAARQGAEVVVLEPSPWVGGMLTAAGVSALDGNKYGAGGGLVHEFREALADHYGSIDALYTGWISLYCYEPHVGHRILEEMIAPLDTLTVLHGVEATAYERVGPRERRIRITEADPAYGPPTCTDADETITCPVFVDATEYGDGLKLAGIPYRLGRESRSETGEPTAPEEPDTEMQDLTYAATLVKTPGAEAMPVSVLDREHFQFFQCSTQLDCPNPDEDLLNHTVHSWERFITYAELPNDKVLLNWPHHANDFPSPVAMFEDRYYRRRHLAAAKQHTMQFVRYMQTELGHPEWQIATDEYPTADHLPPIPYIRESRRLVNDHIMTQSDVVPTGDNPRAPVIDDSIAVGDYFLDHHHSKHHLPPDCRLAENFPDNAPFQVSPNVFFPETGDESFLVGEKSIAVTHIVNGCTRLQPVVMLMGQAIGAVAAHAVSDGRAPADVPVPQVQDTLLDAGCQLYIMYDVPTGHDLFRPVQDLALRGILRDDDPTRLEPDKPMPADWAARWTRRAGMPDAVPADASSSDLSPGDVSGPLGEALDTHGSSPVPRSAFVHALHRSTA